MDSMEKVSAVRTRRCNEFPSMPAQEGKESVSESVLTAPSSSNGSHRVASPTGNPPIWFFEDGSGDLKDLLGGKGAGLAEMTRAGLPVPPGFTLTTEVCLAFYEAGRRFPDGLTGAICAAMR